MLAPFSSRRPLPLGDEGRRRARRPARAPRRGGRARRRRGPHRWPSSRSRSTRVADRDGDRARRLERARPAAEWWAGERERVLAGELIDPVKVGYAESMKLSPRWAAEFRGFWDLPEDFAFDVETPTLPPTCAAAPGKITPEESADAVPRRLRGRRVDPPARRAASRSSPRRSRRCSTRSLSRREVKDIQSGLQGPRPVRQVARGPPGPGRLGRPDRPPDRRGAERRPPTLRRRARDPLRLPATTSAASTATGRCTRPCSSATTRRAAARDLPEVGRTATPSGWSCASSTARSRARLLEVEAVDARLPGRPRLPARHRGLLPRLARARAALR